MYFIGYALIINIITAQFNLNDYYILLLCMIVGYIHFNFIGSGIVA